MLRFLRSAISKRNLAPSTSSDCDLSALRRYQRGVLLGGGCLLSVAIICGWLALLMFHAAGFQARRLEALQRSRAIAEAYLAASDGAQERTLNMAEYAWRYRPGGDAAALDVDRLRFLQGGQRTVVTAGPESAPQMVLGVGVDTWPSRRLDRYLMLAHSLSIIRRLSAVDNEGDEREDTFFLDPSRQLLVLGEGMTEQQLLATTGAPDRAGLIDRLSALIHAPSGLQQRTDGKPSMLLVEHPLTGAPSIATALTARDGGTAIGTMVTLQSTAHLSRAMRIADHGASFVLTRSGRIVAGTASARGLGLNAVAERLRAGERSGHAVVTFRKGLRFFQAVRIAETDWALVSTYCVGDVIGDGRRLYIASGVLTAGLLLGLWVLLAWLHWRAFGPAFARAARVYQGEQLSRALIQLSPVGLCLLDHHSGEPVLENEMMRQLAATAERRGVRLYARMVEEASRIRSGPDTLMAEFEVPLSGGRQGAPGLLLVGATSANYQGRRVLLCAVRDLSARLELEEQQKRARESAEAASMAKGRFLATMSHEIRTPLHGILGHLELLGRSSLDDNQQARLRRITQAADSLLIIINDVLDFSRAESGYLDLVSEPFEPVVLLERVALLFSPLAEAKGLVLDVSVDADVPVWVVGPQARIEQVLRNLVSNAVKFTPSGRVEMKIQWRGGTASPRLLLEVVDSGIGLSPRQVERLFQPYVQADASIITRFGGSGLGLSLCRELCNRMGGEITARSTPGVGTVFSFGVPVQEGRVAAGVPLAGRRVLLASTIRGWREELRRRLEGWGAQVALVDESTATAHDGVNAQEPLVVFERVSGRSALPAASGRRRVIHLSADGPLKPQARGNIWTVSCYAGDALLQALLAPGPAALAAGQGMH